MHATPRAYNRSSTALSPVGNTQARFCDLPINENLILTRSGEERLIEWRNSLIRDDAGRVIGTFSSGTDITERNRVIEALRTAEERTRFALEAAGVGIWDMDYTTGVVRWSETMEARSSATELVRS